MGLPFTLVSKMDIFLTREQGLKGTDECRNKMTLFIDTFLTKTECFEYLNVKIA